MRAQHTVLGLFAVGLAAVGCASASAPANLGTEDEDLLGCGSSSYVALRHDTRECFMIGCGGYFVRELNRSGRERYVASLDTSALGWSEEDRARYFGGAADWAIVVKAHLGQKDALVLEEVYRGMPGVDAALGNAFYTVKEGGALKINKGWWRPIDGVNVEKAALPLVDAAWLERRVTNRDAIVAARLEDEKLEVSQVYVKLPDVVGPCPMMEMPIPACEEGQVMACTRNPDGCMIPKACVKRGICPLYLPQCAEGYKLVSWPAPPSGCDAFACDPGFLAEY